MAPHQITQQELGQRHKPTQWELKVQPQAIQSRQLEAARPLLEAHQARQGQEPASSLATELMPKGTPLKLKSIWLSCMI